MEKDIDDLKLRISSIEQKIERIEQSMPTIDILKNELVQELEKTVESLGKKLYKS